MLFHPLYFIPTSNIPRGEGGSSAPVVLATAPSRRGWLRAGVVFVLKAKRYVQELADEIGMTKSALRKHCAIRGYRFGKRLTPASKGQPMNSLCAEDAAKVRESFSWRMLPGG